MSENSYVGLIEAVIATLRDADGQATIDNQGDVYGLNAWENGAEVALAGAMHSDLTMSTAPVGKGLLVVEPSRVLVRGRYFLTASSRSLEEFLIVKEMGSLYGWSPMFSGKYSPPPEDLRRRGARRVITRVKALSVSPVLYPAGVGTRTIAVKCITEATWLKQERDEALGRFLQNEIEVGLAAHTQMDRRLRRLRLVA